VSGHHQKSKIYAEHKTTIQKCANKQSQTTPVTSDKGHQCKIADVDKELLKKQIDILEDTLDEISSNVITTRLDTQGKPFTSEIREVYYEFLSRGVSAENVAPLIKKVLYCLANMDIGELPSITTAKHMVNESGELARKQIGEVLSKAKDLTMARDATTKGGCHFYGVKLISNEESFTVGLRQVAGGTAETYLESTKEIIADVQAATSEAVGTQILANVRNTMTDRCATEGKLDRLITAWKTSSLHEAMEAAGDLEEDAIIESKIDSFKCAVHPLLQFSEVCMRIAKDVEGETGSESVETQRGESMTHMLLRFTSIKLFYKDGTGDPVFTKAYLSSHGIQTTHIVNSRGNRFNVAFYNAAGVISLKEIVTDYLQTTKGTLNVVQSTICTLMANETVMALCRALGILCHHVTGPYWEVAASAKSAIDMGPHYNTLLTGLQSWSEDASPLLCAETRLFGDRQQQRDDRVSRALFDCTDSDIVVKDILQRMCGALRTKAMKLFSDHIEGGKYYQPSQDLIKSSSSCPSNNITTERLMAQLDSSICRAPSTSQDTRESKLMFRNNKCSAWLEGKDSDAKCSIVTDAMKSARKRQGVLKLRRKALHEEHLCIIAERKRRKEERVARQKQQAEKTDAAVQDSGGAWSSEADIESNLENFSTKTKKKEVLRAQIKLRKALPIHSNSAKTLFARSAKGKEYDVGQLIEHLQTLMRIENQNNDNRSVHDVVESDPASVVGKHLRHTWKSGGVDIIWPGKILGFRKNKFEVIHFFHDRHLKPLLKDTVNISCTFCFNNKTSISI
jgi:hypothetical protein